MSGRCSRWLLAIAAVLIFVGMPPSTEAARRRAPTRSMAMVATAYCLRGITAAGNEVHRGTVAADPRVLPRRSRIRIRGRHLQGTYVVEDDGAAIKGRRIDIYMPSCKQARRFGRQRVTVVVLPSSTSRAGSG